MRTPFTWLLALPVSLLLLGASNSVQAATFVVDTTVDINDAAHQVCSVAANDCSLRGAISKANATPGADTITIPAGTYTLSLTGVEGTFTPDNSINDLDITESVTIDGAGAATTIIQAGTVASTNGIDGNGIDKVIEINQAGVAGIHTTIAAVTIRNGKNTIAANSGDDLGGGITWYGSIVGGDIGQLTVNNCIITNNIAVNNNGGGISIDTGPNPDTIAQTNITITNTIISNNKSNLGATSSGNPAGGGGLSIRGNSVSAAITDSTISGNTAGDTVLAVGGGIQIFPVSNTATASVQLRHTVVSNNTAAHQGGGIYIGASSPNYSFVIDQGSRINGNTSLGSKNVQVAEGGGIFFSSANAATTLTIQDSLIDANITSASSADQRGGAALVMGTGNLVVKNTTISGNLSSSEAGGIKIDNNGTATLTNVTITNNHARNDNAGAGVGGGIDRVTGTLTMDNTIVAGNFTGSATTTADDIAGSVVAASSFNLIGTGGAGGLTNGVNSNKVGVANPGLATLADNGGPTLTHALLSGSAAFDGGSNAKATAAGLSNDQRRASFTRAVDGPDADITDTTDIGALEQHPSVEDVLDQTINEDGTLNTSFNVGDSNLTGGIDTITVTSGNTALVPNANINVGSTGTNTISNSGNGNQTLVITPVANAFGSATITITVTDVYNGLTVMMTDTFVLTVNPVADLPSVTPATTNEDTQSLSGLVVTRNAVDGNEVTHMKITSITNGTLFKNNGTTQINNNDIITFAEANAGLKFTPAANLFSPGSTFSFAVAGATSSGGAGLGVAATASITVNPVADTPSATGATTNEDTQSTTGLVLSRNVADSTEVTHFKITAITNGTLFKNDGSTQINNNDFILFAEGNAGLKFTPASNLNSSSSTFSFVAQGATSSGGAGLSASGATATITVNAINDPPSFVKGPDDAVPINFGPRTRTNWATSISAGPADESSQTLTFNVSNDNNPLFSVQPAISPSGTLTYTTANNASGTTTVMVTLSDNGSNIPPNSNTSGAQTFTINVGPTASSGSVTGRIVDNDGNPVEGAVVRMQGTHARKFITDANGFYRFDNVETNGFYTVTPSRANYTFNPAARSFSQLGENTEAAFSATVASGNYMNPLDTPEYFVRQHYLDFLGREPDEAGFNFWCNNIESCGDDANCRAVKRIDTSAAFFLSIEFQQTGYLVYKTYQAAYGDLPGAPVPIKRAEFRPDTLEIANGVIVNQGDWQNTLNANKTAYMAEFVQRSRFTAQYPTTMTPDQFVDQLFAHAEVMPADSDRTAAIAEFGSASTSADVAARGRALRMVSENSALGQQEFNQAFVLMQYFGYLRRDPNSGPDTDFTGYNFWLNKLNTFKGNFGNADMVKSFLVAGEYRERFPR